eukprot:scaffold10461_cov65-Phaeocystis_antarctica.AAC.2
MVLTLQPPGGARQGVARAAMCRRSDSDAVCRRASLTHSAAQEADWPRLAAPRCRPGHPLALVKPARRHPDRTLVGLVSNTGDALPGGQLDRARRRLPAARARDTQVRTLTPEPEPDPNPNPNPNPNPDSSPNPNPNPDPNPNRSAARAKHVVVLSDVSEDGVVTVNISGLF